jgi:hypothetical protein
MPSLSVGTNSYISNADADSFFDNRLNADAWTSATEDNQTKALITASAQISRLVKSDYKLPLETIAQGLEDATCELAIAMLADNNVVTQSNTDSNIKQVVAGTASVTFVRATKGARFPTLVMEILRAGEMIDSLTITTTNYGTDAESAFCSDNTFTLNRGFS